MSKKPRESRQRQQKVLSELALALLREMASQPGRVEYNTRLLGGAFEEADTTRLDNAYQELLKARLVEPAGAVLAFFGAFKPLYRITPKGEAQSRGTAA